MRTETQRRNHQRWLKDHPEAMETPKLTTWSQREVIVIRELAAAHGGGYIAALGTGGATIDLPGRWDTLSAAIAGAKLARLAYGASGKPRLYLKRRLPDGTLSTGMEEIG